METQRTGDWIRSELAAVSDLVFRFEQQKGTTGISAQKNWFSISPVLEQDLQRLNQFFLRNARIRKTVISMERIRQASLTQESTLMIRELIMESFKNPSSEIGGVASIDVTSSRMYFLSVASENEEFTRSLMDIVDPKQALPVLNQVKTVLPFLEVRTERIMDVIEHENDAEKTREAFRQYMELFMFYSKNSYFLQDGRQYAAIAEHDLPGYYLGQFHVHPVSNLPSPEDKIESYLRRNLVIVPKPQGFELYYLLPDARADEKPEIIVFQDDSWTLPAAPDPDSTPSP